MSRQRAFKQASYAGGCLLIVGLVIAGAAALVTAPSVSVKASPTPSAAFAPLIVEPTADIIRHGDTIDLVAKVRNPNVRAGVAEFPVTFIVVDEAGRQTRHQEVAYVLPGSLQYVVALRVPAPSTFTVRLEVPENPAFTVLPDTLQLPVFGGPFLRSKPTVKSIGDALIEEQKGVVRNDGTYDFQRVELVALAQDAQGRTTGIGKTFLGELRVGEQREFTVQWPAPATPTARVITSLSTNIFLDEAIIRVIGDPSLLR